MTAPDLADASARERAATTFDRNVVVTAGAGTGKTTLLVDRLVHLLMRDPEPLKITEVVALTFTNKAANEMKLRLRERLDAYLELRLDREAQSASEQKLQEEVRSLIGQYHLTKDEIDLRAREALRHIERSEIGTIHSFAATLLRLYPLEAGVDPQFREDDGRRFERHFEESWALWLDQELSGRSPRDKIWKEVLKKIPLKALRELAFSLCSENIPLERLKEISGSDGMPAPVMSWLGSQEQIALRLLQQYPEERYVIDTLLRAATRVLQEILRRGTLLPEHGLEAEIELLTEKEPGGVKAWNDADFAAARGLIRVARRLCRVDPALTCRLSELLIPYAESCRESFVRQGWVSFDGLLVRARDLVRDQARVRAELKRQFKAILIDEFQDTDPTQYEILLYLGERAQHHAKDWREVRLTPGKIFVVGDPKQSIYAFRRADIEAYLEVVEEIIHRQEGIECRLTTNFRSHDGILNPVNGIFERLIQPQEHLQPAYVPIHAPEVFPAPQPPAEPTLRKLSIHRIESPSSEPGADAARRLEAEGLARWLDEEVLGRAQILDRKGEPQRVEPRDVAILLRKLTEVHQYLEPLRKRGIRYVVEGERHFYAAQEVIDAANLLRAVENPYDRVALVGVLRSPLGGLTDREIYELHQEGLLDYRRTRDAKPHARVKELYATLSRLHDETRALPVGEAVGRVFAALPLRLLAAHSLHGEQAVANLEKVREEAELLGQEGLATFKAVVALLQRRIREATEEGESALAEETVNAVRVMSIHRAKGLEFPVVILAGCHATVESREADTSAEYDWTANLVGLRVADTWDPAGVFLAERKRRREEEEQKRVLYVGMTRAREHLLVSYAAGGKVSSESFIGMLEAALGSFADLAEPTRVAAGKGVIEFSPVPAELNPPQRRKRDASTFTPVDEKPYIELWQKRRQARREATSHPRFVTPTLLKQSEDDLTERARRQQRRENRPDNALLLGELAHRFLQLWEFTAADGPELRLQLVAFLDRSAPGLPAKERDGLEGELEEVLSAFFASPVYAELVSAHILGREVPFLIPWNGQVMEGVIDIIYEKGSSLYVADYKTDRVERNRLPETAALYAHQVRAYTEAARRGLNREVAGFKLIFLRLGEALEVRPGEREQLSLL